MTHQDLLKRFCEIYGRSPQAMARVPGRTELGGNHTDHNGGQVLAASVRPALYGAAATRGDSLVCLRSGAYPPVTLCLDTLAPLPAERGTTAALLRGVAAGLNRRGVPVSGFDAWVQTKLPAGAGLSSSAAFELLIALLLGGLYGTGPLPLWELAAIAQGAETNYYGKPCGLLDQAACAAGGTVLLDFATNPPGLRRLDADLPEYTLCVTVTSSHSAQTGLYAAIPREMKQIAGHFGCARLADVPRTQVEQAAEELARRFGDRALLRAFHFYDETSRAAAMARALENRDTARYLNLVRASGQSSLCWLQNLSDPAKPDRQPLLRALYKTQRLLEGWGGGACRVHGGGFAGTIQAYIPKARFADYQRAMDADFGPGACIPLELDPDGATRLEV